MHYPALSSRKLQWYVARMIVEFPSEYLAASLSVHLKPTGYGCKNKAAKLNVKTKQGQSRR